MGAKKREGQLPVSAVRLPSLRLRGAASSSSSAAAKQPEAPSESEQTQPPPPPPQQPLSSPSRPPAVSPGVAEGSQGRPGLPCESSSSISDRSRRDAMLGVFRAIPTQMDYKGQKLAEQIFQGIILFSAVIGFICGYITEQFGWTVYIVMAGFALSCLLTLPPWPIYRRNPLKWLPVQEVATDDKKPADRKVKRHPKN